MVDKELLQNGSGVKDQTAYDAMKNFDSRRQPAAGEVWSIDDKDYLILNASQNGCFVPCLKLVDETPDYTDDASNRWSKLLVFKKARAGRVRMTKYTDVSMAEYVTLRKLVFKGTYHDSVTDEELSLLRQKFIHAFALAAEVSSLEKQLEEFCEKPIEILPCIGTTAIDYKKLYDDLIDRLIRGNLERKGE